MAYKSLRECVLDLERHGHLRRVADELDPHLELAEIQRRAYRAEAPALLFERVRGSPFPALANLFGTRERCRFLFRDTWERVERVIQLKADPASLLRTPWHFLGAPLAGLTSLPVRTHSAPVLAHQTGLDQLPQIQSWPDDGGAFITLPQVLTEDPARPGPMHANVGMYRLQISGGTYAPNREAGLHFQIHRGIGVHYAQSKARGESLKVSVFVGGPPAHTLAAVMPLPEGLSELLFAGMLGGRCLRYTRKNGHLIATDADFCIVGTVRPDRTLPEGPFGDHLGYYSLVHDFPVLEVEAVYHRTDAIWPFTVVGRPPQEDTSFGQLIHELTAPMVPVAIPGLHQMHAVDAAGVHPLLLAIGSERYVPFQERRPQELLTIAHAVLGFGQASLAKFLLIAAREDDPELDVYDVEAVLRHVLERFDPTCDLHFATRTTIDTLDYTGTGLNQGSKVVIAAAGPPRRRLATSLPDHLTLPDGLEKARLMLPGILVLEATRFSTPAEATKQVEHWCEQLAEIDREGEKPLDGLPLLVLVDDATFATESLRNFLWVTFTRSNPSHDIHGVQSFVEHKHWGCRGPLVIDARQKPHHAPPLIEDPEVTRRVDQLAAPGGALHGIL